MAELGSIRMLSFGASRPHPSRPSVPFWILLDDMDTLHLEGLQMFTDQPN